MNKVGFKVTIECTYKNVARQCEKLRDTNRRSLDDYKHEQEYFILEGGRN